MRGPEKSNRAEKLTGKCESLTKTNREVAESDTKTTTGAGEQTRKEQHRVCSKKGMKREEVKNQALLIALGQCHQAVPTVTRKEEHQVCSKKGMKRGEVKNQDLLIALGQRHTTFLTKW